MVVLYIFVVLALLVFMQAAMTGCIARRDAWLILAGAIALWFAIFIGLQVYLWLTHPSADAIVTAVAPR